MIYPSIPKDNWKSVKLKSKDRDYVYHLFHIEQWTIPNISHFFKVTQQTIYWILNPDKYKIRRKKQTENRRIQYYTDKNFRLRRRRYDQEWHVEQTKIRPEFKKFHIEYMKKYYANNKDKWIK